jgi:hypothetical protein
MAAAALPATTTVAAATTVTATAFASRRTIAAGRRGVGRRGGVGRRRRRVRRRVGRRRRGRVRRRVVYRRRRGRRTRRHGRWGRHARTWRRGGSRRPCGWRSRRSRRRSRGLRRGPRRRLGRGRRRGLRRSRDWFRGHRLPLRRCLRLRPYGLLRSFLRGALRDLLRAARLGDHFPALRRRGAFRFFCFLPLFSFLRLLGHDRPPDRSAACDRGPLHHARRNCDRRHIFCPSYDPTTRSDRFASPQRSRHRASGRPVDQLDRMHHRDIGAPCDLRDAADIAGGDHIGSDLRDTRNLAVA